jgi:hypothetical protein
MNDSNIEYHDSFLDGNEAIEEAIHAYYEQSSQDALFNVLGAIHVCMAADRHVIVPVDIYKEDDGTESFELKTLVLEDGKIAAVAFTSQENFEKAPQSGALSHFVDSVFTAVNDNENMAGILLNPWGESFLLTQELLFMLLKMGSTELPPIEHQRHPYLDELDAMGTSEINQIKSLITCQVITNRAKYHRFKQTHMRIASLCGSTNKTHFLTDLTGSRRWMPFEVSAIVNPYENIFPLDRMYAQAYHLYRSGLEYWMTPEDNAVLNQHNEDFRVQDSMEELLHLWFDQPASNCGTFMTSAEIGDFLINQGSIKRPMSSQALSILLKKAGFQPTRKKINGNQIRGFLVYKRERDEVDRIKCDIVTSAHPSDIPTN